MSPVDPATEYARRLYDDVRAWYTSAETKAQVVLGLDGAFLAILTSGIFRKPEELLGIITRFSPLTRVSLAIMTVSLLGSIAAAIWCLRSQTYFKKDLEDITAPSVATSPDDLYPPKVMWFFQMLVELDRTRFERTLKSADGGFEVDALASQIHILAGNVLTKHRAANLGFLLATLTLASFLVAGLSFALHDAFSYAVPDVL